MNHIQTFNEKFDRPKGGMSKTEEVQGILEHWNDITDSELEELPNKAHAYHFIYRKKLYTLYCNSENNKFSSVCTPPRPGKKKTLPTYSLKTPRIVIECWADKELPQLLSMLYNHLVKLAKKQKD